MCLTPPNRVSYSGQLPIVCVEVQPIVSCRAYLLNGVPMLRDQIVPRFDWRISFLLLFITLSGTACFRSRFISASATNDPKWIKRIAVTQNYNVSGIIFDNVMVEFASQCSIFFNLISILKNYWILIFIIRENNRSCILIIWSVWFGMKTN